MTTSITRSGATQRLRLQSISEATRAGSLDAVRLLVALSNLKDGDDPAALLSSALGETIGLAVENRIEECQARLEAFCEIIGPELGRTAALEAKCILLAASLNQADLELAARNLELQFITESEGGEL